MIHTPRCIPSSSSKLTEANVTLGDAQQKLNRVLTKVENLKRRLEDLNSEKLQLASEAELCQSRLKRAGQLTSGLADEEVSHLNSG